MARTIACMTSPSKRTSFTARLLLISFVLRVGDCDKPPGRALIPLPTSGRSDRSHRQLTTDWRDDPEAIDAFLSDASKIQTSLNSTLTTPCHLISRDSSYTKLWTNANWDSHCAPPLRRYGRHVRSWPTSTTAAAVMPLVTLTAAWSTLVCLLAMKFPVLTTSLKQASLKTGLLGSFASPVALLLTLRTNRAMDRLLDARKAWGLMNRSVRTLAGLFFAYVAPSDGPVALLAARYLSILAWSLKGMLRGECDGDVIRTVLPPAEAEWVLSAPSDRPTAMLARLRKMNSAAVTGNLPVPISCHTRMCELLYDLEQAVGICRRILSSPIPPTFTRHTSRLLCLWLGLLPLALLGFGISKVAVITTVSLTTYVLVGIDEIGVEIENALAILPMHSLCSAIQKNVMDQAVLMRDMPDLP